MCVHIRTLIRYRLLSGINYTGERTQSRSLLLHLVIARAHLSRLSTCVSSFCLTSTLAGRQFVRLHRSISTFSSGVWNLMGWFDARAHSVARILSIRIRTYGINGITPINREFNWKLMLERQASQMIE